MAAKVKIPIPEFPTDFMGNDLAVGDMVAFNPPKYKGLQVGIIKSFAPQSARIEFKAANHLDAELCSRAYTDIVKVPDSYKTAYLLKHGGLLTKNTLK